MNQANAIEVGVKHAVWRHRGCGLCANPAEYMCNQCRAEVNEQGVTRTVHDEPVKAAPRRSIIGHLVPADFIYV